MIGIAPAGALKVGLGVLLTHFPFVVPAYKSAWDLASRFRTADTCHLPPLADRMPRRLSALARSARVAAPVAWIARMTRTQSPR